TGPDRTMGQDRSTLSPREAARIAKVGKSTIMRAIESTQLEARRDNRNQWRIERSALDRWTMDRPGPDRDSPTDRAKMDRDSPLGRTGADWSTLADDLDKARLTIAQMEARLEERAALVRAAEADRDRWRALAEKLTDRPTAPSADPASSLTSRWRFWRRG
ncbi:helix-turn-helix domain-containing protein, partial [Paracoccus yeei]|uniref:helix-turn-helix domain-containing protein n=1 Tax=Paracoccus yeei TaxID=147645 RepID=UPI001C8E07B9